PPSHLDSHQHVHRREPVRAIVAAAGERLEVPVREQSPHVRYRGDFYGQDEDGTPSPDRITVEALVALVRAAGSGYTELGCHPGMGNDLDTMYGEERLVELQALCDERVRAAIDAEGIVLTSFATLLR